MSYNQLVTTALARWNGDGNNDGIPDAIDATGNGRNGVWGGQVGWSESYGTGLWGGNSFAFNGNSEIAATLGASGFTNKCMSVWLKSLNASNNDLNIIGIGQDTGNKLTIRIQTNGEIKFVTNSVAANFGGGYDDGVWRHFVVVDNGTNALLYANASLLGTRNSVGTYSSLEINLGSNNFFGRLADAGMEMFDAVWHTADAWDTDDIAELMAGPEPVNTVAPTLSIDGSGNWTGTVGTWALPAPFAAGSNGTITYAWELRRDSDDAVISSGSGASPSGSGLVADTDYYLHVTASNDGGSDLPADSAVDSYTASGPTYTLTAAAGSFTLSGVAAGFQVSRKLTASSASYTLTGQSAVFLTSRKLAADTGSLTLTGIAAELTYTPISGPTHTLTCASGSFALTGVDAIPRAGRKVAAATGTYLVSGVDVTLTYTPIGGPTHTLTCASGSFTITGVNATLKASRKLVATTQSYTLSAVDAELRIARKLPASTQTYTFSGVDAALTASRKLPATAASYLVTGQTAGLSYSGSGAGSALYYYQFFMGA